MRIASLVPSATEMLFALGLGDSVVAVTHECDYPPAAAQLPNVTRNLIPDGLSPAEIDQAVRERTARGEALYGLDAALLAKVAPDLVVTQAVCAVCAVSYDDVVAVAGRLTSRPGVVSLDPSTLDDVLAGVGTLAAATRAVEAGAALEGRARERLRRRGGRRRRCGASSRARSGVARAAVRGWPLGAGDDRARRRRGRRRRGGSQVADGRVGRD